MKADLYREDGMSCRLLQLGLGFALGLDMHIFRTRPINQKQTQEYDGSSASDDMHAEKRKTRRR